MLDGEKMLLNRREFLKKGVTVVGAGAMFPLVFQRALAVLGEQNKGGAPASDDRVLVVVQMAGGNDGLNTIIPIVDSRYYDARPGLGIAQTTALPLNDTTGLHPAMAKMKELWDQGVLAVVEGVGYPSPNFSHFVSMDIWETADPAKKVTRGWLGRYFEKVKEKQEAPFLGLAVGRTLPTAFITPEVAVPSLEGLGTYQLQGDRQAAFLNSSRLKTLMNMYEAGSRAGPYGPLFDGTIKAAKSSINTLQSAHKSYKPAVEYPAGPFPAALLLVAEAIAANVGVKVCHVSLGGFDTHANQPVDQPRQLGILANSLHAFYADLKAHGLDSRVAVMTWSEFGRRVKANASSGTDHGSAAPLFFLGTPVRGGFYGQRPDLGNLDNGNLRYTVDFRSVYATALEGWLGAPARELLGDYYEPFPLWRSA